VEPALTALKVTSDVNPDSFDFTLKTLKIDESKLVAVNPSIFSGIMVVPFFA
jgi:hypothetical protein